MRMNRRLLLFLVLALAAGLLVLQRRRTDPAARHGNRAIAAVMRPFEWVIVGARDGVRGLGRSVGEVFTLHAMNDALQEEVAALRQEVLEREEDRLENARLRRLLDLPAPTQMRQLPAHVVGSDPTNWFRTIRIDKGGTDGVQVESPVIADGGVVGHVIEVTPRRATVLLLLDTNCRIAAILQEEREQGLVEGQHAATLRMTYIDRRTAVEPGSAVLTSGMGGVYPKGLLIGHVESVQVQQHDLFQIASVRPSVDFARLEHVMVLLPPPEEPAADVPDAAAS